MVETVPETERKSEKLVLGLAAKEKVSLFGRSESRGVRDVSGGLCKRKCQGNDVVEKRNMNMTVLDAENPDVNVTDGVNFGGGDNGDATDDPSGSLSSFDDTISGGDGGFGTSDDEVVSEFYCDSQPGRASLGYEEAFGSRKKKVTTHWRNFIRSLMWRCKWAELQMRKFQIQASMYSKLLEEYDKAKETQKVNNESQCSKSLPFHHQMKRRKIMRRTKRKRVEDTTDVTSFMLEHNLFGYFENKGTSTGHAHLTNGYADLDNDEALVQFNDEDTSTERILAQIDSMQSHVHDLTSRIDKVINGNHGRFSYLNKLNLLPSDSGESIAQHPTAPSIENDKIRVPTPTITTQPASAHHVEELSIPLIPVTADQLAHSLTSVLESADQLEVSNKSDDAETKHPATEKKMRVYTRAKKQKMQSENQPNSSSIVPQSQTEKSSLFLASRYTTLWNNQKKRGKRKRATAGMKTFRDS